MKHKKTLSSVSEGDQKAKSSPWPSNRKVFKGRVVPLFTIMQSDEANLRALIKHVISTVGLIVTIIVPILMLSTALNSFLVFGEVALIYILGGSLGALLIMRVRKMTGATSIVPKSSDGCRPNLRSDSLGIDEKAA